MIDEAVYKLYATARSITWSDDGTYTVYDIDRNEITVDASAVQTKATELETAAEAEKTQKATDAANGNQKLLDLGLTQAEATALTGYKPPEGGE